MPGPVFDTGVARKRALAFNNQVSAGTAVSLSTADLFDVANISVTPNPQTTTDPRYTGSVDRPGDQLIGVSHEISFEWNIHGPGSGTLPTAGAWIPGRLLTALGFTENVVATAIGPEAFTSGTTTGLTLGAAAVGTADLYTGYAINVSAIAAAPAGLAMIQAYTSGKAATLARTRAGAPATGNYTIPQQLAYTFAAAKPAAGASVTVWDDPGQRRNFKDWRPTSARIELVTAARDGGQNYCRITVSGTCTLVSEANEAVPTLTGLIPIPPFRGGQQDIANLQLGGSSVTIDLGLRSAGPPNPNQDDGSDPALIVESVRTVSYELNEHARTTVDWNAIAAAQAQHPSQFIYGLGSGNYVGVMIAGQRFNYRTTNEGGDFLGNTGDAWIDGVNRAIALTFIRY